MHMYFKYICLMFARCLLDRVNGVLRSLHDNEQEKCHYSPGVLTIQTPLEVCYPAGNQR